MVLRVQSSFLLLGPSVEYGAVFCYLALPLSTEQFFFTWPFLWVRSSFLLLSLSFRVWKPRWSEVFTTLRPFGYIDLWNEVLTQLRKQLVLFGDKTSKMASTEIYTSGLYNTFTQPVNSIKPNRAQPLYTTFL